MDLVDVILAHKMNRHFAFMDFLFFFKGRNLIRPFSVLVEPKSYHTPFDQITCLLIFLYQVEPTKQRQIKIPFLFFYFDFSKKT